MTLPLLARFAVAAPLSLLSALALLACGDDTTTGSTGAGGAATGSGATSGSAVTGSASSSTGSGGPIPCGTALSCTGGEVCIEEVYGPTNCAPLDPNEMACPMDKLQTYCGGAGETCCCDAPAPSSFGCDAGAGCNGVIDCSCLVCPVGKQCTSVGSETSGVFRCEEPAQA